MFDRWCMQLNNKSVKKLSYFIIFALILSCFWSCESNDDFSSDTNLKLAFSSDTIKFDTVFTSIDSSTKQFKIYNHNKNSLTIESIELMNAAKSGFRINIDGQKGTSFANVDILKKDSLFAFLEVTVDPLNTDNPVLIRDSIKFITNGNTQYIQLEAIGQDVNKWTVKIIDSDTTLTGNKPFLIYDSIVIKKGVTLRMEKNTRFYFRNKAAMHIYGNIITNGTISEPIVMRGDRMDNIESDIPYDRVSGQWSGVYIHSDSYNNIFNNVFIRNAENGLIFSESTTEQKKASLYNTIVHNSSQNGVIAINCDIDAKNCLFTNSKGAALMIIGGKYSFLHCTIANYYRWASREKSALILSNHLDLSSQQPLVQCNITNSIIYGSINNELTLSKLGDSPFIYKFINCVIRNKETNTDNDVNTIWNTDPKFKNINKLGNLLYNFELDSDSPAIDKGDKNYSLSVPLDLNGNSRLKDSNPDIGCYEWTSH